MVNRAFRKIWILSSILFFLLCLNVFAQTKGQDQKHSLWKISSKTNTVYLFGSVHLLKQDAYPLDKSIEMAYENSTRMFFEINFDEMDANKIQHLTIAKGAYLDGRTLKDDLSKQTYELAKKHLADQGLSIEKLERLKPWLLAMSIVANDLQLLGFDPSQGIDKYFYEKAKKDMKKIDGFETTEYQLNLLSDMPARMQEAMLLQAMKDSDNVQKEFNVIIEAWKSGNAEELDMVLLKSFQGFPDVYQRLISDRNKNWVPKIKSLIGQKENAMIILGAAHFVGKEGIIAALKREGYQVEQL
ncbi:MAG TPA: TraB/GumN family protein [Nitrospirota bacterium]|nr:TraB/GumN family protein [Nitrospirota bacterium]